MNWMGFCWISAQLCTKSSTVAFAVHFFSNRPIANTRKITENNGIMITTHLNFSVITFMDHKKITFIPLQNRKFLSHSGTSRSSKVM